MRKYFPRVAKPLYLLSSALIVLVSASEAASPPSEDTRERVRIAASTMRDAIVVDCQLPGRLMVLGGMRQYLSPGALKRLSAIDCRTRGGEYTLGDLSSGTLSLNRWLPLAQNGSAEAQYYVARIYANGMSGVPVDYAQAADWYERAAKQKYSAAMQELGYLYESGLGVPQDRLKALNLQREASGLGDELDYAWKLTAAKEEAAAQIAALSDQLEQSNAGLQALQLQLDARQDELARSRGSLAQAEGAVIDLRAQLKTLRDAGAGDGGQRARELEARLSAKEAELSEARGGLDTLRRDLDARQAELAAQLQKSEATSQQLNETLNSKQDETKSLRASLAQSEQRLIRSQQELADLRLNYRHEVDQVAGAHEEIERIRASTHNNDAAALLAVKQHDLDLQSLRLQTLETELARLRRTPADGPAQQAPKPDAQNAQLRANLADLQTRYDVQVKQLKAANDEMAGLRSKSQGELAALFAKLNEQLAARTAELDAKQRRIGTLENDTSMLKGELARLRDQKARDAESSAGEADKARMALQAAQQQLAAQREALDQLRSDAARERAALLADRNTLQQQLAAGQKAGEGDIAALKLEIQARQAMIAAKDGRIAALEKKLTEPPAPTVAAAAHAPLVAPKFEPPTPRIGASASADYYALVIGNGAYRYMSGLKTPVNDAKSVADLLEQQYGFKVNRLIDASSDEIMRVLDSYTIELKDTDRLLVYYSGHGGTRDGPPERAFWLGVDADPRTQAGWISAEYVSDKIKQMRAKHVLLVSDASFSASITHPTTTTIRRELNERRFQVQWNRRARMVLTSGQNTPVADASSDEGHSLFAKYFLSVLRQNDGVISGEMLSYELGSRMQPEAVRMGLKQTPTYTSLQDANHDYGDFFFLPASAPQKVAGLVDMHDSLIDLHAYEF